MRGNASGEMPIPAALTSTDTRPLAARKSEELLDDLRNTQALRFDVGEGATQDIDLRRSAGELGLAEDPDKRIVDLVGDARGDLAGRGQPVGPLHLLVEVLLGRDV